MTKYTLPDDSPIIDKAKDFLTKEFEQSWGYQQHIESQMVNHLRFYVTLLLGIVSASIAIAKFGAITTFPTLGLISILFLVFFFVGNVLRIVYVQLRIRKILSIENLNNIREYFHKEFPAISNVGVFPTLQKKSPPYLRKASAEWNTLIFIVIMNSLSLWAFSVLVNYQWNQFLDHLNWTWLILIFLPVYIVAFMLQFRSFTVQCYKEDRKREGRIGKSKYDLFDERDASLYERPLIWLGRYFEKRCR